jgi:hypothetical protein
MNAAANLRAGALLVIAAAAVSGVLGVQEANGGGSFVPAKPADPCAVRMVTSVSSGINGLGERAVLLGLDGAACRLKTTREALILDLAESKTPTDAQANAVHDGLLRAVRLMKADGSLPPVSDFTDEALDQADLPDFVKTIVKELPASVIDAHLKTDDVLTRTINALDVRAVLTNLRNADSLTKQIYAAVTQAVKDAIVAALPAPCAIRSVPALPSLSTGINGLGEQVALLGIARTACRLGVGLDTFTLTLANQQEPTDAQVNALRAGLHDAVNLMQADGSLPPASDFTDEALDQADLPGFVKTIIKALPDSVIDAALKTDDVLTHTVDDLDIRALLANLSNPDMLSNAIGGAVSQAVQEALLARLKGLACDHLPAVVGGLVC